MQLTFRHNVLLSSRDAARDLSRLYPRFKGKSHILRFCAALPPAIDDLDLRKLRNKYGLPSDFIYLPNQFYFHKNHVTAVDALERIRDCGANLMIVASGSTSGPPGSNSATQIRKRIQRARLESTFIILGSIPYMDVLGLMAMSSAVLNPSLFEGWSTTVEEAKALGAQLILSDIPVHREQTKNRALYFDPRKPDELAEKIIIALNKNKHDFDGRDMSKILSDNLDMRLDVARRFAEILTRSFQPN